ncbi:MAG: hypothetical protein NTX40_08805 [Planctomycetota bacterium]|nr:hypothetical protein [Planctomycetota bacterium]
MRRLTGVAVLCLAAGLAVLCAAAPVATPPAGAPPESLQKWRDMRFGMFIHWGPVSLKGT